MVAQAILKKNEIGFTEGAGVAPPGKVMERKGFCEPQEQTMTKEEVKGKLLSEMNRIFPAGRYPLNSVSEALADKIVQLKYAEELFTGRSKDNKTTLYNIPEKIEEVLSALREISKCSPRIIQEFMHSLTSASDETEAGMFVKFPSETVELHKVANGREMLLEFISFKEDITAESLRALVTIVKVAAPSTKDYGHVTMYDVILSLVDNNSSHMRYFLEFKRHHQIFAEAAIEAKETKYIIPALENLVKLIQPNRFIITSDRPKSADGYKEQDVIRLSKSCGKYLGLFYIALANDEFLTGIYGPKEAVLYNMNKIITGYGLSDRKICKIFRALCPANKTGERDENILCAVNRGGRHG
ncbi:MAG: hypothetical protein NTX79_02140 [Candidatus Micrarchaeota archaeon]|nr:hypothetical protein [Candidatus Micrarchaeota archaeon]